MLFLFYVVGPMACLKYENCVAGGAGPGRGLDILFAGHAGPPGRVIFFPTNVPGSDASGHGPF